MSKYLGMTDSEIVALKGAALKEVATELAIEGRSKMKADELRVAVHLTIIALRSMEHAAEAEADLESAEAEDEPEESPELDTTGDADRKAALITKIAEGYAALESAEADDRIPETATDRNGNFIAPAVEDSPELDTWHLQPNRKARREAARKQRKAAGRVAQKQNKLN